MSLLTCTHLFHFQRNDHQTIANIYQKITINKRLGFFHTCYNPNTFERGIDSEHMDNIANLTQFKLLNVHFKNFNDE